MVVSVVDSGDEGEGEGKEEREGEGKEEREDARGCEASEKTGDEASDEEADSAEAPEGDPLSCMALSTLCVPCVNWLEEGAFMSTFSPERMLITESSLHVSFAIMAC